MIKISVPNDDHVALRAMAKALEEIAVARGAPASSNQVGELNYKINIDTTQATATLEQLVKQAESDNTVQQVESLATHIITSEEKVGDPVYVGEGNFSQGYRIEVEELVTTDADATPWDERIHSASKALNADGTWRLRRKPKDMDEAEWLVYVETVRDELSFPADREPKDELCVDIDPLQIIEKARQCLKADDDEPPITPDGDDFHMDAGAVTEQQVADIPPPPPVPVPAPPVTEESTAPFGHEHAHMTFPQVMAFLTERHGRITSAQVDQIIADMGLEKITDLNTQPEHTGPFIARVKALLGE